MLPLLSRERAQQSIHVLNCNEFYITLYACVCVCVCCVRMCVCVCVCVCMSLVPSIFTKLYPASSNPVDTMRSAVCMISVSLMLHPKWFLYAYTHYLRTVLCNVPNGLFARCLPTIPALDYDHTHTHTHTHTHIHNKI